MSSTIHKYKPVENWEYQYVNNFGTYPFLLEDIPVKEKFLLWMRLAQRYYIKDLNSRQNIDPVKEMLSGLNIDPDSTDAQCLLSYYQRANKQINHLLNFTDIEDKKILDFGSGHGMLASAVLEGGGVYYALEYIQPVAEIRDYFLENAFSDKCSKIYTEQDMHLNEIINSDSDGFDIIFCNNVLSEMPVKETEQAIIKIKEILKTDGLVVIQDWLNPKTKCDLMSLMCRNFNFVDITTFQENVSNVYVFLLRTN